MRRQIVGSVRAGESTIRVAERLLAIDKPIVELPRYVRELKEAAQFAKAAGDPNLYEEAAEQWRGTINKLGEKGRRPGAFTVRSAGQQLVKDLRKAKPEHIDRAVDRWVLERARHQARTIARNEAVEAYRDSYIQSNVGKDYVKGYRWNLSASHPNPDICLRAGTQVVTSTGPKPIENVKIGDAVLTHRGRYRAVNRLYRRSIQDGELVRLRFQAGQNQAHEVVSTPNHPVLTSEGWIPAGDLRKGMIGRAFVSQPLEARSQSGHDNANIGRSGSPESATSQSGGIAVAVRCDERTPRLSHTSRTSQDASLPTVIQRFGIGIVRYLCCRLSTSDSPSPYGLRKVSSAFRRTLTTFLDAACRSWDYLLPVALTTRTSSNSIFDPGYTKYILHRREGKSESLFCGPEDNNRSSRNAGYGSDRRLSSGVFQKLRHTIHTSLRLDVGAEAQRTSGHNRNAASSGDFPPPRSQSGTSAGHNTHKVSFSESCPTLTRDALRVNASETVYNLGVEEDQSYTANGICVHNCDIYAGQDLDGLGPGGYLPDGVPSTPHTNCLCHQTAIMDRNHFKRKTAKLKRTKAPAQDFKKKTHKTAEQLLKQMPEKKRLRILGPTRNEALKEGKKVVTGRGWIRPVYEVMGTPKPVLVAGPSISAAPLVKREVASMVRPFPVVPPSKD